MELQTVHLFLPEMLTDLEPAYVLFAINTPSLAYTQETLSGENCR